MNKIGKYEIIGIIGKGAMGIVYKARDPDINREVAIKTVRFDLVSDESEKEEIMQRFMREAQAAGKLAHPNIITIYDVGREESVTYIVMQLIEGQSLQKFISSGEKYSTPEVIELMCQVCNALDYAHRNGIVHRDMKPGNILLDKDRKPFICDFGVARVETSTLTQSGTAVGTPSYMSPEQVMGKKVDKRSDIFSLGCILYEVLTGRRPFEAESITTVIYKIINEGPPSLSEVKKGLPIGFEHIITKALAKDPNDRYQSCIELASDLRAIQVFADKTIAITMAKEELPRVAERKKRNLVPVLAILLGAIVILAGGGGYYLYHQGRFPFLSAAAKEKKGSKTPSALQIPGSIEDKLSKAKESLDRGDLAETARLAEEILAADASNLNARELLDKAKSKITLDNKAVERSAIPPAKAVIPGSIEDKLNRAKQSLEKKDYTEAVRLAKEVLSVDAANLQAQEYRDRAETKIRESALIAQTLSDGISSYNSENYEQCLHKMEEVLKLDSRHPEALRYRDLADRAIYEAKAKEEINQIIGRQRKAEEDKDLLLLINDIGSQSLRQEKQLDEKNLFNYYDQIKWSSVSNILFKFKDRNHAEVRFSYISTAVYKKTGTKATVFAGEKTWTMEKQGDVWKIISEEKK